MAETMTLRIVTPEGIFYEGEASLTELLTTEGRIGVYPGHMPVTYLLAPGPLAVHGAEGVKRAEVAEGFTEILQKRITVVAESARWSEG